MLQRLVAGFCRVGGVEMATLLDSNGYHISGFTNGEGFVQNTELAIAALQNAEVIAAEHNLGKVDQLWVEKGDGNLVVANLAAGHRLILSGDNSPNLGRLRHEVNKARPAFAELI